MKHLKHWRTAGTWVLVLLTVALVVQDLTGSLSGRSRTLRMLGPSQSDPQILRLQLPDVLPDDLQMQRQVRVWQGTQKLRGPYRHFSETRDLGAGIFSFGNVVFVHPFGAAAAEHATFRAWIPRAVPSPLRWAVYGLAAVLLIMPATRARYRRPAAEKKKLRHLEAVRGLACLTVVIHHFSHGFYPSLGTGDLAGRAWNDPERLYELVPFLNLIHAGPAAVDIFFILSGLVLFLPYCQGKAADPDRLRIAFLKRPVRLWGIMAAVMVMAHFLNVGGWYFGGFYAPAKSTAMLLHDVFLTPYTSSTDYNAGFWTIRYELIGSFGVYLFAWLVGNSPWRRVLYGGVFLFIHDTLYADFLLGMILADALPIFSRGQGLRRRRVLAAGLLLLGLILCGYPAEGDHFTWWSAPLLRHLPALTPLVAGGYGTLGGLLVISSVLISGTLQRLLTHPWLTALGRISYAAYGSHGLVFCSVAGLLMMRLHPTAGGDKFSFEPDGLTYHLAAGCVFVVYLILAFFLSMVLTVFVDEPCTRFSGRLARWILRVPEESAGEDRRSAGTAPTSATQAAATAPTQLPPLANG